MIDFSQKTYANIQADMLARVPNTYDKRDTSPIPTATGPAAWTFEGFYLTLDQVQRTAFLQTAAGQSLDYLAPIAGLSRYPASAAVRLGVFNAPVPIGARFSTVNGAASINFAVTAAVAPNQCQLTAETAGSIGNEYAGPILPITTIPGLTSAQITDILISGDNQETDEALRARIIAALNERPFGGNIAAYRDRITGVDGVGAVQIYPTWDGGGTVKCSVLGSDYLPASGTLVELIQNLIDPPPNQGLGLGYATIGAKVTIVAPTAVTVDVSATLTLAQGVTIDQVKPLAQAAIHAYLLEVRKDWATPRSDLAVVYTADVYLSRVLVALVGVSGVLNVSNVTLNGAAADLSLTETGGLQEVPVLGEVTLSAQV